ncbi:MAG: glutamate-5-semialdehyde dehydrogenase [Burkholderiales bacterium]|nr:glutamate-5-semialdehyde dehydrogenase [Burkholderiales bacterium]
MNHIMNNLSQIKNIYQNLPPLSTLKRNKVLSDLAQNLKNQQELILAENKKDLLLMNKNDPNYDRLELTLSRINSMIDGIYTVIKLKSNLNKTLTNKKLPNGLVIKKVATPLGLVAIIFESRPNVTIDVFTLCFKSGNACILKGGKEATLTNKILVAIIHATLRQNNLPECLCYLLPNARKYTNTVLSATNIIDVCIPRGSSRLINYVRDNARIPIIETGAGIVHVYFDKEGDIAKAKAIISNAKTRRVSVCNALDCLIIHQQRLNDLPQLLEDLAQRRVVIYADMASYTALTNKYPSDLLKVADNTSFGTEFLDYKMAIKTVSNINEAIQHIHTYSSFHSEAIISENKQAIKLFLNKIDAAAVYVNASTAFTDGGEFGLGAEIGISTQKLHARGPMGLNELNSYKWIIHGNGHIRS